MASDYGREERVFNFNAPKAEEKQDSSKETPVTYRVVESGISEASPEHPIMVLADPEEKLKHHQNGRFLNPRRRTAFETSFEKEKTTADVVEIDKRFIHLLMWLGEYRITARLSGKQTERGYAIYKIHSIDPSGRTNQPASNDAFLQLVIRRLLASSIPEDIDEDADIDDDEHLQLNDMASMVDFLSCAGESMPRNIRSWAYRNIALVKSGQISQEERRHAQRSLSMMMNIQWKGAYFESIDPVEARRILDEELYGLERVKQRVIETIIQINRTHTLPAYGLLLIGPAGTGKSQIAYAVARILRLPWIALDMSTIKNSEALTGSPRIYSNAKPGRIMEGFYEAGESNLVMIINELDKSDTGTEAGNPADALLTLLDNLGYTDNYIECTIPTNGVYPIATANEKDKISDPLMTRFAVIDIPDYTREEKKIIFLRYALPRVLSRMGMTADECIITDAAADVVIDRFADRPGVRDLEQAAEHLAANALYRIETTHVTSVRFDGELAREILEM